MNEHHVDVLICGGGLAGLGLGIQLLREKAVSGVAVAELRRHPAPEAAFKVGESSVEIGAHYLGRVLGLEPHIRERQLPKLGLRYFYTSGDNAALESRFELGGSTFYPTPSYQLDRGRLENHMAEVFRELGGIFLDGTRVQQVELGGKGGEPHRVTLKSRGQDPQAWSSTWLVDATGRASLLKMSMGSEEDNGHRVNAVWWRMKERIKVDDWVEDQGWQTRQGEASGRRWLSTNHLMGKGYWVWLIPLASGSTSVGIVADAGLHPFESMDTFDRAVQWLEKHEPQCAGVVKGHADSLEDFIGYRDFSYGCRQVFSRDRWCLTGEAGLFLDPFYSPGSDFIGMSNTFVTDLVKRHAAGERIAGRAAAYDHIYHNFFWRHLTLYKNQYPVMGHALAMTCKVIWDFAYYWTVPAYLFFHGLLCDLDAYAELDPLLDEADKVNVGMQELFRTWSEKEAGREIKGGLDITSLPFMLELNGQLSASIPSAEKLPRQRASLQQLRELREEMTALAGDPSPDAGDYAHLGPLVQAVRR